MNKQKLAIFLLIVLGVLILGLGVVFLGCGQNVTVTSPISGGGGGGGTISFEGISSATAFSTSEVTTAWKAATASGNVTYYIYFSTSESNVFTGDPAGIWTSTSFIVNNLSPDTTYFFGVRASDEAGNSDTNTVTKVASTEFLPNGMKGSFDAAVNKKTAAYSFIGARFFGPPYSDGQAKNTGGPWFFAFSDGKTIEVWSVDYAKNAVSHEVGSQNYQRVVFGLIGNMNSPIQPDVKLDSCAAASIAMANDTIKSWVATNRTAYEGGGGTNFTFRTDLALGGTVTWELQFGSSGQSPTSIHITIDSQTGTVLRTF